MVSVPFTQTTPSLIKQSTFTESTAIKLDGIKNTKPKNNPKADPSKRNNLFEKALEQSTTAPNKPTNKTTKYEPKVTTTKPDTNNSEANASEVTLTPLSASQPAPLPTAKQSAPTIDETTTFNALVQSQLALVSVTPISEVDPDVSQPLPQERPISQNNPLPTEEILQPVATKPPTLTDSPSSDAENQSFQPNKDNAEAFLSNDNDDNKKSNNPPQSQSNESHLLTRLTTSEASLPPDLQPVIQPLATIDTAIQVPVTELTSVVEQVGGKLEAVLTNGAGNKQVNIVLQPESLGTVRVQLQQGANQSVSGKIIVQTPEAFTALTQQLDVLKGRIEGQGITLQKLEVVLAPAADNLVLDSQQHLAVLDASNGAGLKDAFTQQEGQTDAGFNNQPEDPEAFSMDKYRQHSGGNSPKDDGGTANQQERKEAYQAHLNELRGLRSYRSAMRGTNSSQYA